MGSLFKQIYRYTRPRAYRHNENLWPFTRITRAPSGEISALRYKGKTVPLVSLSALKNTDPCGLRQDGRFKLVKSECERLFVAIYRFPTACDGTLRPAVNWRKVAHRAAIFTLFYHSHATTLN